MENNKNNSKQFVERILDDYTVGEYDDQGFFNTPNGSFWDPDGVYFNREGFDKHGGYYDDNQEYVPGEGWDEENNCYKDEYHDDDYYDEYGSDHDYMEDDGFGDIDMDNIQDEEKLLFKNMNDIEKITEDPSKVVENDGEVKNSEEPKKEEPKKEEIKKEEEPKKEEHKEEKKKSKLAMLFDEMNKEKKNEESNKEKNNKKKSGKTNNYMIYVIQIKYIY
jgi:hypothetical protein